MRNTNGQNAILQMTSAVRVGYNCSDNVTTYKYKFNNGHVEIIQVEGCKTIDPVNLFLIKCKHNREFSQYIKRMLEVK